MNEESTHQFHKLPNRQKFPFGHLHSPVRIAIPEMCSYRRNKQNRSNLINSVDRYFELIYAYLMCSVEGKVASQMPGTTGPDGS